MRSSLYNACHRGCLLLVGPFLLVLLVGCFESHTERLQRLESMIANNRATEAIKEINTLLSEQNTASSQLIDETPARRLLKNSLDGRMAAWLAAGELHFISGDVRETVGLEGKPIDFSLSYSGNFALVLTRLKETCQYQVLDIRAASLVEAKLPLADCDKLPLITDDGRFLYTITNDGVTPVEIGTSQNNALELGAGTALQPSLPQVLPFKKFPAKYKKIKNRFELFQMHSRGFVAFRGAAGYYQLYLYPGSSDKLSTTKSSFARAALYSVYDGDTLPASSDLPEEAASSDEDDSEEDPGNAADQPQQDQKQRAPGSYLFQSAHAFAYTGSAGKRRMRALHFGDRIKVGTSFPAPVWQKLQFIRDREEFMVLTNEHLYYWNPITRKKAQLPLVARDFILFDGGLLYVDLTARLYLRKEAFSRAELDLVRLRSRAQTAQDQ